MLIMRASSLGKIMTEPKDKNEILSVGAKTYIKDLAKEFVYGFEQKITSKYMDKGLIVEDESIQLYNDVFFTNYKKNTERKTNEFLTGECDIFTGNEIIDIKSSWDLTTFPCFKDDGINKDYEWQGRAYMMLWDVNKFKLAYCMVDTPEELLKFEQEELHYVSHIDPALRITVLEYDRDLELEAKIEAKCIAAQGYFNSAVDLIASEHNF